MKKSTSQYQQDAPPQSVLNSGAPSGLIPKVSYKALIRQPALCDWLDLSRSGLDKLRKKDPTFPKPLKDGESRQAAAFYVVTEVEAWIQSKIDARDAG